jgi:hypothetical protein
MNDEQKPPADIGIDIQELGHVLMYGKGDQCLDFLSGAIVAAADCPEAETGEARPALRNGKRFVRIPQFDELGEEIWERMRAQDRKEERQAKGFLLPKDLHLLHAWNEVLRGDFTGEQIACRWIASLRPPMKIAWLIEDIPPGFFYNPDTGEWE